MIRAHTIADVRAICGVGQGTKADDLTQIGDDVLQGRWLRLALMHLSYLREHQSALPINAELLRMLESLGSRWCRRFMLEAFLSRERAMLETCGSAGKGERKGCTFPVSES